MRDLIILGIVLCALPFVFYRAYIGVLLWAWLGYMNPHRLSWGFAYDFPFAQFAGIATLIALPFDKGRKGFPISALTIVWIIWVLWMNVTTLFALNPDEAAIEWDRTMKIMLISFVTVLLMQSKRRLDALAWTIVISLGFYGVKGGVFTILTGGEYKVFGPVDTFIGDNNSLALALIMTLPLMRYVQTLLTNKWAKLGATGAMLLTGFAILASHSRGALLAGAAMALYLWAKGRNKLWTGLAMLATLPFMVTAMPDHWFERMETISEYEQDGSAMGRINAWTFAYNLAVDHPLVGGGYNAFSPDLFLRYAPEPLDFHDSHSIYFEVLGEHGFVGLILFLLLGWLSLRTGKWINRAVRDRPDLGWARELGSMVQVSLISYAVGGAFLGLAYFDLVYHLVAIVVCLRAVVTEELRSGQSVEADAISTGPAAAATEPIMER